MQLNLSWLTRPHPAEPDHDLWFREEARAERLANLLRIVYMILWVLATTPAISIHPPSANWGNVGVGMVYLGLALLYHGYLLKRPYHPAQKYLSTSADVIMTTAILFFYHYDMGYATALKAPPFMNYLMMLALAAFRFNIVLPIFGSFLAALAYGLLLLYLVQFKDVAFGSPLELFTTGKINGVYQLYRLAYLFAVALLTSLLVGNVRRLVQRREAEAVKAAAETARRKKTQSLFERYFTPELARYLTENPQEMGGHVQPATILFCDIRGFTALSESLGPAASVELLNRLFESLVNIVFKYHGTLDKFLGDGMLVVFGTPTPAENDAVRAILAAREMLACVRTLGAEHNLKLGVAVHSGPVIFGNIGSSRRMELTVIGDAVNTASRLESQNKVLNTDILISETTHRQLAGQFDMQLLPPQQLRGKKEAVGVYTLVGEK